MYIKNLSIQNFRSLKAISLQGCAGLNVVIGKNNSGKSNILGAIDLAFSHLRSGRIAADWRPRGRAIDEITNRQIGKTIQVALEISIDPSFNQELRDALKS